MKLTRLLEALGILSLASALGIALGMALGVSLALAADPVPPERYTIEVTPAQIQIISRGLGEIPLKDSAPVIQDIQGQLNRQIEEARKKAEAEQGQGPGSPALAAKPAEK